MNSKQIFEYLTPAQRSRYEHYQVDKEARTATDHFFGVGNDMVREDVPDTTSTEKGEVHLAIERAIGQEISVEDYKRGTVKDRYNRDVKIGRLIKDEKLRNQFASDPARQGTRKSGYYATIHRGTEVAGQTNSSPDPTHPQGHSWGGQSCKNVDTGCNRHYLKNEIRAGTVVVFIHEQSGKEIYRATLHPFRSRDNKDYAYALDAEYGVKNKNFTAFAKDVAYRLASEIKSSDIRLSIHPSVYNDGASSEMIHPRIPDAQLEEYIRKNVQQDVTFRYYIAQDRLRDLLGVLSKRELTPSLFAACLSSPWLVKEFLLKKPDLSTGQRLEILRAYPAALLKLIKTLPTAAFPSVVQLIWSSHKRPLSAAATVALLTIGKPDDWEKLNVVELQKALGSATTIKKLPPDAAEYVRKRVAAEIDPRTMKINAALLSQFGYGVGEFDDSLADQLFDNVASISSADKRDAALILLLSAQNMPMRYIEKIVKKNIVSESALSFVISHILVARVNHPRSGGLSPAIVEFTIKNLIEVIKDYLRHLYRWDAATQVIKMLNLPEIKSVINRMPNQIYRMLIHPVFNNDDVHDAILTYVLKAQNASTELLHRIMSTSRIKDSEFHMLTALCNPNCPVSIESYLKTKPSINAIVNVCFYNSSAIFTTQQSIRVASALRSYLEKNAPTMRRDRYRVVEVIRKLGQTARTLTRKFNNENAPNS